MRTLVVLTLTVAVALACGDGDAAPPATPPALPAGLLVQAESLPILLPVAGTITSRNRAEISTRLMARVTAVPVQLGATVRAGQTLIRLGLDDIAAHRAKAEAAVTAARAAHAEAARHAARMDTLYAQDVVSQVQRDQAHLGLTHAASQLAMARAALTEVETADGYARIVAPFDGVVAARTVDPGDLANPGMPLLVLESIGPREAVLAVPVDLTRGLAPGSRIRLTGDGRTTDGPIRAVAGGADPMTRTVEVRIEVPADWPTGVSVTGFVPAGVRSGVAIPASAVVRRGQLTGVRVVAGDGERLRWIRLGRTLADDRVEVLSGLEPGERIRP